MSTVYVVGGGPSLTGVNLSLLRNKTTIGINKSIFYLQNPTHFVTMDYTIIDKLGLDKLRNLRCSRFFVANLSIPYLNVVKGAICDTRSNKVYQDIYACFDSVILCRQEKGIGKSLRDFRCGNNSGYCGLQLAVALGYTKIFLLGIDLTVSQGHTHFHQGYRERYSTFSSRLPRYHATFLEGISLIKNTLPEVNVYSCSPISPLNEVIPYVSLENSLKETFIEEKG